MRRAARAFGVTALAIVVVGKASGQAPSPNPSPRPSAPPCATPHHRQFDFWVGDWNVKSPAGALLGTNLITREYGGCVIQEHWVSGQGGGGSSFNIYTPATKSWHQTWVDSGGTLLLLDGEFKDGKMQLSGETPGPNGGKVLHQVSFEPRPDGKIRQLWQSSNDAGKTWSAVFDGFYERKRGN